MHYLGSDVAACLSVVTQCPAKKHYPIGSTSRVIAYQHWELLCRRGWSCSGKQVELCVDVKAANTAKVGISNRRIYFYDDRRA